MLSNDCPRDEAIRLSVEYIANKFLDERGPIKTLDDYERVVNAMVAETKRAGMPGYVPRKADPEFVEWLDDLLRHS